MSNKTDLLILKIARDRITQAGNRGKKRQYHVDNEVGDAGWMDYTKGIRDACWAIDELMEEVKDDEEIKRAVAERKEGDGE